jgi:hypothetical protein
MDPTIANTGAASAPQKGGTIAGIVIGSVFAYWILAGGAIYLASP